MTTLEVVLTACSAVAGAAVGIGVGKLEAVLAGRSTRRSGRLFDALAFGAAFGAVAAVNIAFGVVS